MESARRTSGARRVGGGGTGFRSRALQGLGFAPSTREASVVRQSDATKAAIKSAVDIVGLVGEYLPLRRAGSRYKALCPFHDDRNPSLELNPQRQTFKCWSCGAGGDVFDFIQRYERVEFPEALRMLAERSGIVLEAPSSATAEARPGSGGPSKSELLEVLDWAERLFVRAYEDSAEARGYTADRGLSAETAERFRLGLAPEARGWLLGEARKRGFGRDLLEGAGLVVRPDGAPGEVRERFRGRLIFPIRDERGRTIGFGGRILPEAERLASSRGFRVAKYLNSPETLLFQKRRVLYAADLARSACRESGWIAVVEGYTDVLAAHQAGLRNVVGTLGTAFGDEHARLLRRLADRVCLVFDGDAAGQTAAERALEIFLSHELDVRVLSLPAGLDPCDFLLREGADAFRSLVDGAVDPLAFVLERAGDHFDFDSIEGARRAAEWTLGAFARIPSQTSGGLNLKVDRALDTLAHRLRIPTEHLKRRLGELRRAAAKRAPASEPGPGASPSATGAGTGAEPAAAAPSASELYRAMDPVDRELIEIVVNHPEVVGRIIARVTSGMLRDAAAGAILDAAYEIHGEGESPSARALAARLEEAAGPGALVAHLEHVGAGGADPQPLDDGSAAPGGWEERLDGVLERLAQRDHQERVKLVKQALEETDRFAEPDEHRALQLEYRRLLTQRAGTKQSRPDPTFRA